MITRLCIKGIPWYAILLQITIAICLNPERNTDVLYAFNFYRPWSKSINVDVFGIQNSILRNSFYRCNWFKCTTLSCAENLQYSVRLFGMHRSISENLQVIHSLFCLHEMLSCSLCVPQLHYSGVSLLEILRWIYVCIDSQGRCTSDGREDERKGEREGSFKATERTSFANIMVFCNSISNLILNFLCIPFSISFVLESHK